MTGDRTAGLVLGGGEARRMGGGDKPLDNGRRTMLAAVIEALDLPDIAIAANGDPARFARFGQPVLSDGPFQGQGRLAGILAGDFAERIGMRYADYDVRAGDPFANVNTRDDLVRARATACIDKTYD